MENKTKLGVYDLRGPAVERFQRVADDNHADVADEDAAVANFRTFSDSFFETQLRFLNDEKLAG
ncbi:hypothetical protein [Shinella sp.]|uniref:hypothetical protein n=1 Tax=Shinella sp. TaxID=1870904 RepID=UPI0029BAAC2B|nr:hypothetical protein [Shinella sp.]MDX3978244.1 hypothetical protein [Shinella sp.]